MQEPPLDLAKVNWSRQKEVVRVFYKEMWDRANTALVPQIFHPAFTFRGSLGPELVGHEQFIGYVRFVTDALDRYTSDILALGEDGNQVFGKLRFHGYHRRELFEVQPSGRHVWWYGAPIFTFDGELVKDLWVLGDIHGLIGRLKGASGMKEALPRRIIELCGLDVETTSPDPRRVTSGDRAAQQTECHINREPREALSAQVKSPNSSSP